MDEEIQASQSKISLVEAILIGIVLIIVSLLNLIPFVGDVTSFVGGALMFFYLYRKGLLSTSVVATNLIAYLCGFIPILQVIPLELLAWVITVIIANVPQLEAIAEEVGKFEEPAEGGVEAGAAQKGISAETTTATQTGTQAASGSQTIEMTQTADGTYEYKGEGQTEAGEQGESRNMKPSETSTEREVREREEEQTEENRGGQSDKEADQKAKQDQLERQMEPAVEQGPEVEAGERAFGVIQGGRDNKQNQDEEDEAEEENRDLKKAA